MQDARLRDALIHEGDHRIANNLSIVSGLLRRRIRELQSRENPINGIDAISILKEVDFQIEVIASLHKLLANPSKFGNIDLDQYLRTVCNAAILSLTNVGRVRPEYRLSCERRVAPDFAVSIALSVAELLTNSFKYAHPAGVVGEIVVAAASRGDRLVIEVADDGVGLPDGYDPTCDGSLGLQLVRATAARWNGTVEFDASDTGLCVRLVLPVEACQGSN